ncbi:uncharacterized protein LOC113294765 [Papaver somniferum]|uniref:uncharacterized protein LOC113294765 n=1 Tax=Papaver somniferum TaxID=3469 RepID=UPI000E6F4C5F|nr:uncharacterized protein LOC113294765 [Papaver somniferum]
MVKRGYELASRCCVCEESQDSMNHLLWHCYFSVEIWIWLVNIFEVGLPHSFDNIWNYSNNKSPLMKEVWITAACSVIKELWFQKNKKYFEEVKPNIQHFKQNIIKMVSEGGLRMKGTKWNHNYDLQIIDFFNLGCRQNKFQCIKSFYWIPPQIGFTLFYCDGASVGNPRAAGFGIVVRNHLCQVVGGMAAGIGIATNYIAETYVVVCAAELTVEWGKKHIIISSDSKTVISEFARNQLPWFTRMRWLK